MSKKISVYLTICKVGLPSLIRQGLSSVSSGLLNNLTRPYGDAAIAAMSVVNRFSAFVMCVGLGIGQGFKLLCKARPGGVGINAQAGVHTHGDIEGLAEFLAQLCGDKRRPLASMLC